MAIAIAMAVSMVACPHLVASVQCHRRTATPPITWINGHTYALQMMQITNKVSSLRFNSDCISSEPTRNLWRRARARDCLCVCMRAHAPSTKMLTLRVRSCLPNAPILTPNRTEHLLRRIKKKNVNRVPRNEIMSKELFCVWHIH